MLYTFSLVSKNRDTDIQFTRKRSKENVVLVHHCAPPSCVGMHTSTLPPNTFLLSLYCVGMHTSTLPPNTFLLSLYCHYQFTVPLMSLPIHCPTVTTNLLSLTADIQCLLPLFTHICKKTRITCERSESARERRIVHLQVNKRRSTTTTTFTVHCWLLAVRVYCQG